MFRHLLNPENLLASIANESVVGWQWFDELGRHSLLNFKYYLFLRGLQWLWVVTREVYLPVINLRVSFGPYSVAFAVSNGYGLST